MSESNIFLHYNFYHTFSGTYFSFRFDFIYCCGTLSWIKISIHGETNVLRRIFGEVYEKYAKAVEMIEIIKKETADSENPIHKKIRKNKYSPKLAVTMALRSRRFDKYVSDFLSKYPEGTVINLGCGLDTHFYLRDTRQPG